MTELWMSTLLASSGTSLHQQCPFCLYLQPFPAYQPLVHSGLFPYKSEGKKVPSNSRLPHLPNPLPSHVFDCLVDQLGKRHSATVYSHYPFTHSSYYCNSLLHPQLNSETLLIEVTMIALLLTAVELLSYLSESLCHMTLLSSWNASFSLTSVSTTIGLFCPLSSLFLLA